MREWYLPSISFYTCEDTDIWSNAQGGYTVHFYLLISLFSSFSLFIFPFWVFPFPSFLVNLFSFSFFLPFLPFQSFFFLLISRPFFLSFLLISLPFFLSLYSPFLPFFLYHIFMTLIHFIQKIWRTVIFWTYLQFWWLLNKLYFYLCCKCLYQFFLDSQISIKWHCSNSEGINKMFISFCLFSKQ